MKNLLLMSTLLLLTSSTFAQAFPPAPQPTDSNFVADEQYYLDKCVTRPQGPMEVTIEVNRVVGEVQSGGRLLNPDVLVANGVVSQFATLRLMSRHSKVGSGSVPQANRITFNGVEIAPVAGEDGKPKLNEYRIPIGLIRFGNNNGLIDQNPTTAPLMEPTPGENYIEIFPDLASPSNQRNWCTTVDWASLRFDAIYPVLLVNGNNSCGDFFSGDYLCQGSPDPDIPPTQYFTRPFEQFEIPFDNSINLPTQIVAQNAEMLRNLIPAKASTFGAKHVHIVAHSKGGLDVREFLTRIKSGATFGDLGVLSLTTLSTPHLGSVGADYQEDAKRASVLGIQVSDNKYRARIAKLLGTDAGKPDLRVDNATRFHFENVLKLPTAFTVDGESNLIRYFALSADANLDNSEDPPVNGNYQPTISLDETKGVPYIPYVESVTTLGKPRLYTMIYRMMGDTYRTSVETRDVPLTLGTVKVLAVKEYPEVFFFQENDFAVTTSSAVPLSIEPHGYPAVKWDHVKANHATVASADAARIVIGWIRFAQNIK